MKNHEKLLILLTHLTNFSRIYRITPLEVVRKSPYKREEKLARQQLTLSTKGQLNNSYFDFRLQLSQATLSKRCNNKNT